MAILAVQLLAPAASADPISAKRAEAARLTTELQRSADRLDIAAERVNNARIKADSLKAQVADASAKMREADQRAGAVKAQLREAAVSTYMRGGQPAAGRGVPAAHVPPRLCLAGAAPHHAPAGGRIPAQRKRGV